MLVSVCSRRLARGSAYHSSGIGSVRLSLNRYSGLGSSRLFARAQLGTRESAQWARLNSELSLGSARSSPQGSPGDWLGTRDSTRLVSWPISRYLARLGAWDRAGARTRFGLEARPGSRLRARSGLGARLGSEPGSAHLGSENIINETKHERRKCKTKTASRERT